MTIGITTQREKDIRIRGNKETRITLKNQSKLVHGGTKDGSVLGIVVYVLRKSLLNEKSPRKGLRTTARVIDVIRGDVLG